MAASQHGVCRSARAARKDLGGARPVRRAAAAVICAAVTSTALAACSSGGGAHKAADAGKLSGDPVNVMFKNTQGKGALTFPDYTTGAQAGVEYVNDHGGVNGHPLALKTCFTDGSPESSVGCANEAVTARVVTVADGFDLGTDAGVPILRAAGIATTGIALAGTAQGVNQDAFVFGSGGMPYVYASLVTMLNHGAKKVANIGPQSVQNSTYFKSVLKPMAEKAGVDAIPVYYNATSPQYLAAVQTAKAKGAEGIMVFAGDQDCVGLVQAIASVGFHGPVTLGACTNIVKSLGAKAQGSVIFSYLYQPLAPEDAPADKQRDIETFVDAMKSSGHSDLVSSIFAQQGFALVIDVTESLKKVEGSITAASYAGVLKGLKNFPTFMGAAATCDPRPWPGQSACTESVLAYKVGEDGKLHLEGNGFLDISAAK